MPDADPPESATDPGAAADADSGDRPTLEEVEERYDFDAFGPADMDEMSGDEWEVAFDPDSWVTGTELLDRVEADLRARIDRRDVFAVLERETRETESGVEHRLLARSDEGYAAVYEDGSVVGEGTVLRDVKPSVALCSMPEYEVPETTGDGSLPDPESVPTEGSGLGNTLLLVIGGVQLLAGVVLLAAWVLVPLTVIGAVFGIAFLLFGLFLVVVVANARLAARFRSAEYRDRLRSIDVVGDEAAPGTPSEASDEEAALADDPGTPSTSEENAPSTSEGNAPSAPDRTAPSGETNRSAGGESDRDDAGSGSAGRPDWHDH